MSSSRICLAAVIAAAALPVSTAAAMPPDLHGVHHRATTADVERPAPARPERSSHEFPWIETAGLAALVAAAGATTVRRRRSVPA
jgi:MYXO-CTERM domain-containing protein